MKITGIIAEYNPFHNGHEYHIQKIKESDKDSFVVAVMSGNFVQRGEGALFDKFTRARMALLGGADVVIELPACFALQSADGFANGGIRILNALNCIDELCFGSESGDTKKLIHIASALSDNTDAFEKAIKNELEKGLPFSMAKLNAAAAVTDCADIIKYPNDLLGIEYIKSLISLKSDIKIKTVKRIGAQHSNVEINSSFSSASAIRKSVFNGDISSALSCIPQSCKEVFFDALNTQKITNESFFPVVSYILRQKDAKAISNIQGISEGLENKLISAALDSGSYNEFMDIVVSKRYTASRINRALMSVLLNITKDDIRICREDKYLYARILGFRKSATEAVSLISKKSAIPVITKAQDIDESNPIMKKDILASDVYFLATRQNGKRDYKNKLIII